MRKGETNYSSLSTYLINTSIHRSERTEKRTHFHLTNLKELSRNPTHKILTQHRSIFLLKLHSNLIGTHRYVHTIHESTDKLQMQLTILQLMTPVVAKSKPTTNKLRGRSRGHDTHTAFTLTLTHKLKGQRGIITMNLRQEETSVLRSGNDSFPSVCHIIIRIK